MKSISKPLILTLIFVALICGLILHTALNTKQPRHYKAGDTKTDTAIDVSSSSKLDDFLKNQPTPPDRPDFKVQHNPYVENPHESLPPPELGTILNKPNWDAMMDIKTERGQPRDAQPVLLIPPQFPKGATKSGHCKLSIHINAEGKPINIYDVKCSEPVFLESSKNAVFKQHYPPKVIDGKAVDSHIQRKITFRLTDERGRIIPE